MKRPLIFTKTHGDFHILWIWRIALIYCSKVDDNRKFGIWDAKQGILFFVGKKGIGIGHGFGIEPKAYKEEIK